MSIKLDSVEKVFLALPPDKQAIFTENGWPYPKPLSSNTGLPTLDRAELRRLLPGVLADFTEDVGVRLGVRPEFVAAPLFSVLGGLAGRRVAVRPKLRNDWRVYPCCLWSCICAPPGSKKSPILSEVRRLVDPIEDAATEEFRQLYQAAQAHLNVINAKRKSIDKRLATAIRKNETDQVAIIQKELVSLQREEDDAKPTAKRFLTSDSTQSKLIEIMASNPGGIILFRDELEGLVQSFEQMGNESLRAFYLEAWNGSGRATQDRIGAGTRRANAIAATIMGATQPEKLARIVVKSDDGFIQRFGLLLFMAETAGGGEDVEPEVSAFNRVTEFCKQLVNLDGNNPTLLPFSVAANEVFVEWERENTKLMHSVSTSGAMKAHLAKYPAVLAALAGVIQLTQNFSRDSSILISPDISPECLSMAADWLDSVFLPHARYIYESNPTKTASEKLAQRIQSGQIHDGMKVSSLARKHWEGLSGDRIVDQALGELEDLAWLKIEKAATGGRPSLLIRLNPNLGEIHGNSEMVE